MWMSLPFALKMGRALGERVAPVMIVADVFKGAAKTDWFRFTVLTLRRRRRGAEFRINNLPW
jgi:hypothetical protein